MITDESVERVREGADIVQIIGEYVKLKRVGQQLSRAVPVPSGHRSELLRRAVEEALSLLRVPRVGRRVHVSAEAPRHGFPRRGPLRRAAKSGIVIEEVQRRADARDPRAALGRERDGRGLVPDAALGRATRRRGARLSRVPRASRARSPTASDSASLRAIPTRCARISSRSASTRRRSSQAGLLVMREDTGELRPRFRNRLIFPILDRSRELHVGFGGRLLGPGEPKYLNSAESPVFSKGKLLYGLNWAKQAIRREGRVMIVEGYFDVVRLMSPGFEWVVAPLGTALTEDQAALLPQYAKHAFLLYDNDKAGLKATFKSGDQLLAQQHGGAGGHAARRRGSRQLRRQVRRREAVEQRSQAPSTSSSASSRAERGGYFADLHRKRVAIDKLLPTLRATADSVTREIYIARASEVVGREARGARARGLANVAARREPPPSRATGAAAARRLDRVERRRTERRRRSQAGSGHRTLARSYTSTR